MGFSVTDSERYEGEPHDRLTRICDDMTKLFDSHSEHRTSDRCIVLLDDGVEGIGRGGIVMHGYERDADAVVDLLTHVEAILKANGLKMEVLTMGDE